MTSLVNAAHIVKLKQSMESSINSGELEQIEFPLEHFFAEGLYGRRIFVRAGATVITAVHKKEHLTIALKGHAVVVDELGDRKNVVAPAMFITPAGTQRAVYAIDDVEWATVHAYEDEDKSLETVEKTLICDTMQEFNQLLEAV